MSANRLWYTSPAGTWGDALPLGNGRMGAMVFGGIWREHIQLNEDTLWSGGPDHPTDPEMKKNLEPIRKKLFEGKYDDAELMATDGFMGTPARQSSYQPLGDVYIEYPDLNPYYNKEYHRELDIDKAMFSVSFKARDTTWTRRAVISPDDQVLAIQLGTDKPGSLNVNLFATSPQQTSSFTASDNEILLKGKNGPQDSAVGAIKFEARFSVECDGEVSCKGDYVCIRGASSATILIAMATNYTGYRSTNGDPSKITQGHLAACKGKSFDQIAADTAKSHQAIFRRVSLDLGDSGASSLPTDQRVMALKSGKPDPALLALYTQYGRYLLITSSRPDTQAATLQGIWNDQVQPPWDSKYTININIQMNYWPAESAGMPEMTQPLIQLVKELAQSGEETAKAMYNARGWVAHHNTDIWRASAPIDLPEHGLWPLGGAWFCQHLWNHYAYHADQAYLKEVYPILRGACEFFIDTLVQYPGSDHLVVAPTTSPENHHGINGSKTALTAGATMDNMILRELFTNTIEAEKILGVKGVADELENILPKLRPTEIGKDGRIKEWYQDVAQTSEPEPHHRHTSHLFDVFPGNEITPDLTPDLAKAAAKVLDLRGEPGTGWATAWRINLWARLQQPEKAYELVEFLVGTMAMYNLFDLHPPLGLVGNSVFQIDGNFGGVSGVVEMLVQSRPNGDILLLPALPKAWPKGHITGIRLRGDWTVDVFWEGGKLVKAKFTAAKGATRKILLPKKAEITLKDGESVTLDCDLRSQKLDSCLPVF